MTKTIPETSVQKLIKLATMRPEEVLKLAGFDERQCLATPANRVVYKIQYEYFDIDKINLRLINPHERWHEHIREGHPSMYRHLHRKSRGHHGGFDESLAKDGSVTCSLISLDMDDVERDEKPSPGFFDARPYNPNFLTVFAGETCAQSAYTWLEHKVNVMPVFVEERGLEAIQPFLTKPSYPKMDDGFRQEFFDELVFMMNCMETGYIIGEAIKINPDKIQYLGYLSPYLWDINPIFWSINRQRHRTEDLLAQPGLLPEINLLGYLKHELDFTYRLTRGFNETGWGE